MRQGRISNYRDKLRNFMRALFTAVFTPFYFSYESGHFLSASKLKAVDKDGQAIPWYTYSAIDFLAGKDFTNCTVLEFGAGQSTLWWAKRAQQVISLEDNPEWYDYVKKYAPANVSIYHVPDALTDIRPYLAGQLCDVIIIDGLNRQEAAKQAIEHLKDHGAIILDDAEGLWVEDAYCTIIDLFRRQGFSRIDFYGYAPACFLPSCTSIFFKNYCFLIKGEENPVQKVKYFKQFCKKIGVW